jgi:hypothetical protein
MAVDNALKGRATAEPKTFELPVDIEYKLKVESTASNGDAVL